MALLPTSLHKVVFCAFDFFWCIFPKRVLLGQRHSVTSKTEKTEHSIKPNPSIWGYNSWEKRKAKKEEMGENLFGHSTNTQALTIC